VPRISYVDLRARALESSDIRGLRDGLGELGYVERQTILIEYRFAEEQAERLPGILDELLRSKVDFLLTPGTVATQAAQRATATVPIVMTTGDPVKAVVDALSPFGVRHVDMPLTAEKLWRAIPRE
jgi:putative ABC transport system substrate-binding protein